MNIQLEVTTIITALVHPIRRVVALILILYTMVVMVVMKVVKCRSNSSKIMKWKEDSHYSNK